MARSTGLLLFADKVTASAIAKAATPLASVTCSADSGGDDAGSDGQDSDQGLAHQDVRQVEIMDHYVPEKPTRDLEVSGMAGSKEVIDNSFALPISPLSSAAFTAVTRVERRFEVMAVAWTPTMRPSPRRPTCSVVCSCVHWPRPDLKASNSASAMTIP